MLVQLQLGESELHVLEAAAVTLGLAVHDAHDALTDVSLFVCSFVKRSRQTWVYQRFLDRRVVVDQDLSGDGLDDAHGLSPGR